jgi:hypothetical protein
LGTEKKRSPFTIIAVLALIIALVLAITVALISLKPDLFFQGDKVDVSDLIIDHGTSWLDSQVKFSVTNLYTSAITEIGINANDVNYGYSTQRVPAGQTQNEVFPLSGLAITNSASYNIELTFTFDNGQYTKVHEVISPPKYVSGAIIDDVSFTMTNETFVSITFRNTGNIPLTDAKIKLGDYETVLPLSHPLVQNESAIFDKKLISGTFQNEVSYPAKYTWTFADGSTFTATNSVTFHQNS